MADKQTRIATISCLLIMLSTVLAFYLLFENLFDVEIQRISLLFLLLSEAILMAKFLLMRTQTIIAGANITSSIIHIVIISLVFIFFVVFYEEGVKLFVLINVVLLSVLIIFDLLIFYVQCYTEKGNKQPSAQDGIRRCAFQVQQLLLRYKGTAFYTDLCKIEELLKYSDNTAVTGDEIKIGALISELSVLLDDKGTDSALIYAKTKNIMEAIQERTAQMKVIKRGEY